MTDEKLYTPIPIKYSWYKELWWNIIFYCWTIPKNYYYNVKWFFGNLWRFRKILWNYRTWDYYYCNNLFADSLDWLAETIKNGHEETRSANKKVTAIKELSSLLRNLTNDNDFGLEEPFINKEISTSEYNERYKHARKEYLDRIYRIIYGQEHNDYDVTDYDNWVEHFDGTGYESWWD